MDSKFCVGSSFFIKKETDKYIKVKFVNLYLRLRFSSDIIIANKKYKIFLLRMNFFSTKEELYETRNG